MAIFRRIADQAIIFAGLTFPSAADNSQLLTFAVQIEMDNPYQPPSPNGPSHVEHYWNYCRVAAAAIVLSQIPLMFLVYAFSEPEQPIELNLRDQAESNYLFMLAMHFQFISSACFFLGSVVLCWDKAWKSWPMLLAFVCSVFLVFALIREIVQFSWLYAVSR